MARRNPAKELAVTMLAKLQEIKERGVAYPPALKDLAEADVDRSLLLKAAAAKKPFGEQAVLLQAKNIESPVVLKGDERPLLQHPRTLVFLVESSCSAEKPTVEPGKLKTKVPAALRGEWDEALKRHLEALPEGIDVLQVGKKRVLHLKRYPLPPPPEEMLAENMIEHLRLRRQEGDYPVPLALLQRDSAAGASAALIKKALASKRFKEAAVLGMKAHGEAPVALTEDKERLAGSDPLLLAALRAARTGLHQVAGIAELKKKVAFEIQAAFAAALKQRREDGSMPPGVGCLSEKKGPVFFFLDDVLCVGDPARSKTRVRAWGQSDREREPAPSSTEAFDFEGAFDAAFGELDRAKGGHNFVSLLDLRPRIAVTRSAFDEGLKQLRRAGKYTMSASEGRHGLSAEELEAGVREDGAHLLYVSRKK